jgi:GNAT superfamily N-acetyltransferase
MHLLRIPVDKPQAAVAFLHARSQGVMDLIAHFWERLSQTPPLQRADLHLLLASPHEFNHSHITIHQEDIVAYSGAMLYVPKAHRADVIATDPATAAAFAAYIIHRGPLALKSDNHVSTAGADSPRAEDVCGPVSFQDFTGSPRQAGIEPLVVAGSRRMEAGNGQTADDKRAEEGVLGGTGGAMGGSTGGGVPIDFLSGHAETIGWMVPWLLPVVHRKAPARELVNVVMQLPAEISCSSDENVRVAKAADLPTLNRWRRQYKEERGILFDADLDAWVHTGRLFVYEHDKQIVAVAKVDLELHRLMEIGGVYTFPEFRQRGFGGKIVSDLAYRIRQAGKVPTLQVDVQNIPALTLYEDAGWQPMGKLARVWLTG